MDPHETIKQVMLNAKACGLNYPIAYRVAYSALADHLQRDPTMTDTESFYDTLTNRLASNLNISVLNAQRLTGMI